MKRIFTAKDSEYRFACHLVNVWQEWYPELSEVERLQRMAQDIETRDRTMYEKGCERYGKN